MAAGLWRKKGILRGEAVRNQRSEKQLGFEKSNAREHPTFESWGKGKLGKVCVHRLQYKTCAKADFEVGFLQARGNHGFSGIRNANIKQVLI